MNQTAALLIVFGFTLFDHAGTPNAYVIAMAFAPAEDLNPYAVFAAGFLSVLLYENAVYWIGRYVRGRLTRYVQQPTQHVDKWPQDGSFLFAMGFLSVLLYENAVYRLARYVRGRLARYVLQSAQYVNKWLEDGSFLWLMFGRFVAFAGLYVPFGAGHMGLKYGRFLAWTTVGSVLQMSAFGILAYQLGRQSKYLIKQWGWTGLAAAVVLMAVWSLLKRLRRRRKRRRSEEEGDLAEQAGDELQNDKSDDGREV